AVGRLATPQDAANRVEKNLKPDVAWCREKKVDYLPVIFPGFSWVNLSRGRGQEAKFDAIPRRDGDFLWSQALAAKRSGAEMIYVAMFDEMDEATAIFKTSNTPPNAEATKFLANPALPTDHYLWLTGAIGRMLRGDLEASDSRPLRK
ncbi:MAG: xylosidase/arabinosidase, partial [Roseimicrobium sp.]